MIDILLDVQNLKTYFKTSEGIAQAVDGVSFQIGKGGTFAIVGESGCGKSVTALSIMRLLQRPSGYIAGGKIMFGNTDITALHENELRHIRGNKISMIFQEPMTSLNPVLTIGSQITEAILLHQNVTSAQAKQKAIEMLAKVGIPEPEQRFREYPHQMSGGMRQRVMIAIALSCQPALLIADEPTTALDVTIQAQILNLIKDLQREMHMAVLLITHDLGVVNQTADAVAVMYAGKIVEQADRETLFRMPLHPYTIMLLRSLPGMQKRGHKLEIIKGMVPGATQFPTYCRFSARCPNVMQACTEFEPPTVNINGHLVSCFLYAGATEEKAYAVGGYSRSELLPASEAVAQKLLEVKGLEVHFPIQKGILKRTVGHVKAVDGVDFSVNTGRTVALVGESGCGKTTAGKAILQLVKPTGGSVKFDGTELVGMHRSELRPLRRNFQIIFQDPYSSLNPRMTVGEMIEEGMIVHNIGADRGERLQKLDQILKKVGLDPEMRSRYPHEFSGGQRQRIGIARALAVQPEFIVCDEATSALDVSVQAQILNLLKDLQSEFNLAYLFITHNLGVVEYLADYVLVMYLGRIVERGRTEEVFRNTKHPYTKALLEAVPKLDDKSGLKKIFLEGDVPSPVNPPQGCHFHPRCKQAMDVCKSKYPDKMAFSADHSANCHLYLK